MDRRGFLSKAPLAVAGAAISANEIKQNVGGFVKIPSGGVVGIANPATEYYDGAPEPNVPNMPRDAAFKLLGQNPLIRREVRSRLVQDAKYAVTPNNIDPDIAILKSISPMAKLFLARQRYIERGIVAALEDNTFSGMHGRLRDFVEQKAHELMWAPKNLLSDYLKS